MPRPSKTICNYVGTERRADDIMRAGFDRTPRIVRVMGRWIFRLGIRLNLIQPAVEHVSPAKSPIAFMAFALVIMAHISPATAQTTLTSPQVLVCPVPLWPPSVCPKPPVFSAITNTANAAGSVSKTAPLWQHTFNGYAPTAMIVACPSAAIISADNTKCTNSAGADVSALIAASGVPTFRLAPIIPATKDYSFSWGAPISNSDGSPITDLTGYLVSNATNSIGPFLTWTLVGAGISSYTYKALPTSTPQCFAIAGFSASNGAGQPVVFCQPSLTTSPGPITNGKIN